MQPFTILLVFFISSVTITQGAVGPPILYNSSQTGPALFSWSLSDVDTSVFVMITSPAEEEVLQFSIDTRRYDITTLYQGRVNVTYLTYNFIQFSLTDVTRNDAGNYTCWKADHEILPNCGQILYYLDENSDALKPYASISKEIREGQTLTLTCVMEVTSLPLPPFSWNWTFQPSASTPPPPPPPQQLQETGVTLTLGPLTREDSGLYSCWASSVAGQSILNLTVIDKSSTTLKPNESTSKPDTEETSFRTATIVLGVFLSVAVIVILALVICARRSEPSPARPRASADGGGPEQEPLKGKGAPPPDVVASRDKEKEPLKDNGDSDPSDEAETATQ